jgi:ribonucleoside-diphosphate reductase alpha chain
VPLVALVDKFRHARFEPAGMTSNKDIPFAKSVIDYIFCWLGCQFIPGYKEKNVPNRGEQAPVENKTSATMKQLVEKTKSLTEKIAEAKAIVVAKQPTGGNGDKLESRFEQPTRASLVKAAVPTTESEQAVMEQFSAQFEHFQDDAPACDVCGSITVRNGTCYKCFNCGNSMGCS